MAAGVGATSSQASAALSSAMPAPMRDSSRNMLGLDEIFDVVGL